MDKPAWIDEVYTPPKYTRYCFVPICKNDSLKTPDKHFFHVPHKNKAEWCQAVGKLVIPKRPLVICEDHLDLEHDLINYKTWIKSKGNAKLRPSVPFLKKISKSSETTITSTTKAEPGSSRLPKEICTSPVFEGKCILTCTLETDTKSVQMKPATVMVDYGVSCNILPIDAKLQENITFQPSGKGSTSEVSESEMSYGPSTITSSATHPTILNDVNVEDLGAVDDDDLAPPSPCPSDQAVRQEIDKPSAPRSLLKSTEGESAAVFSWQQSELISADEVEVPPTVTELEEQSGVTLYCDESPAPRPLDPSVHEVEYRCNDCEDILVGCRYWCVQCEPRARCAGCAARGAHDRHYVLRSPAHTPHWQTELLLAAIRQQLQKENMLTQVDTDGVKVEVKVEELGDVESAPAPPDPLECTEETESGTTRDSMEIEYLDDTDSFIPIHEAVVSRTEHYLVDSRVDDNEEDTDIVPSLIDRVTAASVSRLDDNEGETEIVTSLIDRETAASVSRLDDNEEETEIVTSLTDHDYHKTASVSESILSDRVARRSTKRGSWQLLARDLTESMRRSSEAVVKLRPLSSAEIRKNEVHIKKKRK